MEVWIGHISVVIGAVVGTTTTLITTRSRVDLEQRAAFDRELPGPALCVRAPFPDSGVPARRCRAPICLRCVGPSTSGSSGSALVGCS
jgi:hypothetical protein